MKRRGYTMLIFALLAGVWACDPVTDPVSETAGGTIASASELQATVTVAQVNGKKTNKVHVCCTSPVICQWSDGVNTLTATEGDMIMLTQGQQTITLTARTPDGKTFTKDFSVLVEEMTEPVDPAFGYFFGNGEKYWEWNTDWDAPDGGPVGHLIMAAAEPAASRDYWGWIPELSGSEGMGAKMKFTLQGKLVTKYDVDGAEIASGSFDFDMTPNSIFGSLGTLTFKNTNILYPTDPCGAGEFGTTYTITYLDNDHLMLFTSGGGCSSGWYYVFSAVR
jgi:hypothetical protein